MKQNSYEWRWAKHTWESGHAPPDSLPIVLRRRVCRGMRARRTKVDASSEAIWWDGGYQNSSSLVKEEERKREKNKMMIHRSDWLTRVAKLNTDLCALLLALLLFFELLRIPTLRIPTSWKSDSLLLLFRLLLMTILCKTPTAKFRFMITIPHSSS